MRRLIGLVSLWMVLAAGGVASAQDPGAIGLVTSTSGSVGIIWHATERVAIRPVIVFTHSSADLPSLSLISPDSASSTTSVRLDLSALFYLARWEGLRAYVAPGYGRTFVGRDDDNGFSTREESQYRVEGLFGLQYALGSRFAIFGETGVGYSHLSTETTLSILPLAQQTFVPTVDVDSSATGTISRVGVTFYF